MRYFLIPMAAAFLVVGFLVWVYTDEFSSYQASLAQFSLQPEIAKKSVEELIQEAKKRSSQIKGVYMTADVANDKGKAATRIRENIKKLIRETELNGVVIDVKEANGIFLPDDLKNLIADLRKDGVWVIARLVAFRDNAGVKNHPELFIKTKAGAVWRDNRAGAWMDAASPQAWNYIASVAKRAIDIGFDEIQFDYVRFPSDGNLQTAVYPAFNPQTPRYEYLKKFFAFLSKELKFHKPDIILSADLFGYVATSDSDLTIGQRLADLGDSFDYISFMVYPSHYYAGFQMEADSARGLPALYYPYRSKNVAEVVSNHPYEVVYRSLVMARDFLDGKIPGKNNNSVKKNNNRGLATTADVSMARATTTATSTAPVVRSHARFRPWLQNFDLGVDASRGIFYDAEKVRAQIQAAEDAGANGWLLWNPANVYTEAALRKDMPE